MKVKTSVTLSMDLVKSIDRVTPEHESRIERLLRERLAAVSRLAVDARDRALIDSQADELNAEMLEGLADQAER